MIESLHPLAIGVVVACMPVATVAVSAGVDYLSRRQQEQRALPPPASGPVTPGRRHATSRGAEPLPAATRLTTTSRKP